MKLVTGIASTTDVDAHGDAFAKEALDSMATQIRSRFIPHLLEHDPNRQVGVILDGRVEQLEDGEFALLVVACIFDGEKEARRYANGATNSVWQDYTHHLDGVLEAADQQRSGGESQDLASLPDFDRANMAALLEAHLDSTSVWRDGRVYKIKHRVADTGDLSVHVYGKDHDPPHFHVISKQRHIEARFHLDTLDPFDGSIISARDVK
jgi:hypothetical protein